MFRHVLTSSTQPEIWSIHVVVRTEDGEEMYQNKNKRVGRAETLLLLIRAIVLWCSPNRRRR